MAALAQAIPAKYLTAMRAPIRRDALATTLRRWRRVVRKAGHSEYELKLFGGSRGDDPELATLFLRYPPI